MSVLANQKAKEDVWVHTVCEMCLGACGTLAHRVEGVVVDIKGDPDCPSSRGKICSKGHAAIMSLYDPSRLKTPLKRTNPEKGIGIDPQWQPISWDEALSIVANQLTRIRKEDPRKLVISTFDDPSFTGAPFAAAFETPNYPWGGYFCGQYLHSSMYLTNGTFHCNFDSLHCKYLLLFGDQAGFGAGLNPNITAQNVAEARKKGMRIVVIDPLCNNAGAKADEWVAIRPGTDGALILAMINILLNELGICDWEFVQKRTNGPYLVKPDGYYVRHDGKPLVWDVHEGRASVYDSPVREPALEGEYVIDSSKATPAFQLSKDHVKKYTPEFASEITTVPPATIRRLAAEFGKAANIGSTVVIDGRELPFRPVAANIYRGAGAHKHGVGVALAVQILNMIVGAFYSVGSHRGQNLIGPDWKWQPTEYDGLIVPPKEILHSGEGYYGFEVKPPEVLRQHEVYNSKYSLKGIYRLDPSRKYSKEEIYDLRIRNEFGGDKDLNWFKEHGFYNVKRKTDELFPLMRLKSRFPIYYENIKEAGRQIGEVTRKMGLDWDIGDYQPLPDWKPCPAFRQQADFDLFAINFRVATHSQSWTVQNAWLNEVAKLNPYVMKLWINTATGRKKGISDGNIILVESQAGRLKGVVKLTECIHPETIGISSHFGGWSKGKPLAALRGDNFNCLLPFDEEPRTRFLREWMPVYESD